MYCVGARHSKQAEVGRRIQARATGHSWHNMKTKQDTIFCRVGQAQLHYLTYLKAPRATARWRRLLPGSRHPAGRVRGKAAAQGLEVR